MAMSKSGKIMSTTRNKTTTPFYIEGQALSARHQQDEDNLDALRLSLDGIESPNYDPDQTILVDPEVVHKFVNTNKRLLMHVDSLRSKLEDEKRENGERVAAALEESQGEITSRDAAIEQLTSDMELKDGVVGQLVNTSERQMDEIIELRSHIDELRNDLNDVQARASDFHSEIVRIQRDREKRTKHEDTGASIVELSLLQSEVTGFRDSVNSMQVDLTGARDIITNQETEIKLLRADKKISGVKFKDELNRLRSIMKVEVDKVRDVMLDQWTEMKHLREDNAIMRQDIGEIKKYLKAHLKINEGHGHSTRTSDLLRKYNVKFPTAKTMTPRTKR